MSLIQKLENLNKISDKLFIMYLNNLKITNIIFFKDIFISNLDTTIRYLNEDKLF